MTILKALADRYERRALEGKAPIPGFAPAQLSFAIILDPDGAVVTVDDLRTGDGKKRRPTSHEAPQAPPNRRGELIVSGAFWDPSDYALGLSKIEPGAAEARKAKLVRKAAEKHAAFKSRHARLLEGVEDPECTALLRFLSSWHPSRIDTLNVAAAELAGTNISFRLDNKLNYVFESEAARDALTSERAAAEGMVATCLVRGTKSPIARLHPPIKGVGDKLAPLVSFNEEAFESYGKKQGFNAPISETAAFAYATALNALIDARLGVDAKGRPVWANRIGLGSDTVVFWAETDGAEEAARNLLDPPSREDGPQTLDDIPTPDEETETDAVRTKLRAVADGHPIRDLAPEVDPATRIYVLGLSPNAARLSVRFWLDQSFGDFERHMQAYRNDLAIEPAPKGGPPKLWALLYEIAPLRKLDDGIRHLAGEMMRAILTGGLYPASLLTQALMRVRAEKVKTTPNRVALIKTVLARRARKTDPEWKDTLVALDRSEPNIGYRLGRLFAVLDAAQYAGIGTVNAGVRDKYFSSASATPGHIFPILLRGAQDHLSAARKKGKGGRAFRLDGDMREILGGVSPQGAFPTTLTLEDQGRFVIGFYHQDAELRIQRVKNEEVEAPSADTANETSEDDK